MTATTTTGPLPSAPATPAKCFVVTTKWGGPDYVPVAVLATFQQTKKYLSDNASNLLDPVWYTVPVLAPATL